MNFEYFAVIRHGKAKNNDVEVRHAAGDMDAYDEVVTTPSSLHDLIPHGIREMTVAGNWLKRHQLHFDDHYVSSYLRALNSAFLLDITGAHWELKDWLSEKDAGKMNAMKPHEVTAHFDASVQNRHARDNFRYRPPGGESFLDLETRVRGGLESIESKRPLFVCHGHVIRVIDRKIMGGQSAWDFGSFKDTRGDLPNGVLIEYQKNGASWKRRLSIPSRNSDIGTWELIVRPMYSNEALGNLIEKVRTL